MQRILSKYAIAFVLASALLLASATVALAGHSNQYDYDYWSFEWYEYQAIDRTLGITYLWTCNGTCSTYYAGTQWYNHQGAYVAYYSPGTYSWSYRDNRTVYDEGEMNYYGAGSYDWYRLYTHERAHQTGWKHYEEPYAANAAYYPTIDLCSC